MSKKWRDEYAYKLQHISTDAVPLHALARWGSLVWKNTSIEAFDVNEFPPLDGQN